MITTWYDLVRDEALEWAAQQCEDARTAHIDDTEPGCKCHTTDANRIRAGKQP